MYIGGIYEETHAASGAITGGTKYYGALGRTVAMRTSTGGLTYLLADQLGSTVGVMDGNGVVIASSKYWPYGATRSGGVTQTDKLYTGQQVETGDALGLYNYKARFYSTVTGRFVSTDPLARDGLNRYSYVNDNPTGYSDPSGYYLLIVSGFGATCARWYCHQYDAHLLAYWMTVQGRSAAVAEWMLEALKGSWDSMGELERVHLFDVAFDDPSEFTKNKDEQCAVTGIYNHVKWLNSAAPEGLTYAFGTSYGGLVLHDFIVASRTGVFDEDRSQDLRGVIISAAPTHEMAALYGVDLFPSRGTANLNFPVVTRTGASQAYWAGRIADFFGYVTSLTVDGALNLPGTSNQHESDGGSTITMDFQYLKRLQNGEPVE